MEREIVNFLFEVGILNEVPRSGYQFLGNVRQSVAEHSYRISMIAYSLAKMEPKADEARLIKMCLFHDVAEARTGDQNYVHRKYVKADENAAIEDLAKTLPFGDEYRSLMKEFHERKTLEAKLARDADQLELLLMLKRASDIGHKSADEWIYYAVKRLATEPGKKLGKVITETRSDKWWFTSDENWWVNGRT